MTLEELKKQRDILDKEIREMESREKGEALARFYKERLESGKPLVGSA